jgi:mRNA interferase MazF
MSLIKLNGKMNQFDVYTVELDPAKGHELKKTRPAVIISPAAMNKNLQTVIVAPLTHTIKGYPSRVTSKFQGQTGEIVLDQLRAVDKTMLKRRLGRIDKRTSSNIKMILKTMFS